MINLAAILLLYLASSTVWSNVADNLLRQELRELIERKSSTDIRVSKSFLKKGTKLRSIDDPEEVIVLPKGIYVRTYGLSSDRSYSIVLDKKGNSRYFVTNSEKENIKDVLDLDLPPTKFTAYKQEPEVYLPTKFKFTLQAIYNAETFDTGYLEDFTPAGEGGTPFGNSVDLNLMLKWDFPVRPGLNFNYHYGLISYETFETRVLNIASIGPIFDYQIFKSKNFDFLAVVGANISLSHKANGTQFDDPLYFSSNDLVLGLMGIAYKNAGKLIFGLKFKKKWVAFDTGENRQRNTSFNLDPAKATSTNIGVNIGYEFEVGL